MLCHSNAAARLASEAPLLHASFVGPHGVTQSSAGSGLMIPRCSGVWAAEETLDGVCMVIVGSAIYIRADHDDFHVYSTREFNGTRGRVTTMEGLPTTLNIASNQS